MLSGGSDPLVHAPQVPEFMKSRFLLGRMDRIISISPLYCGNGAVFSPATSGKMTIINYGNDLSSSPGT